MTQRKFSQKNRHRFLSVVTVLLTALSSALFVGGCRPANHQQVPGAYPSKIEELAVRRNRPDRVVEAQARGHQVYQHYCQICHGTDGKGDGFNSTNLVVPPRDFTDPEFWKQANDESLTAIISRGGKAVGKSVLMPPWGRTLDEQQIRDAIAFLRTVPELAKRSESAEEDLSASGM